MSKISGFSLVELLVSMFIAVVILGGVVNVVSSSSRSSLAEQESAFIQENLRYAMEVLTRDIRVAGYSGCAATKANKGVAITDTLDGMIGLEGIFGFENSGGDASNFPVAYRDDAEEGESDSIVVRYADDTAGHYVVSHAPGSQTLTLSQPQSFGAGSNVMIVDANCMAYALFKSSGPASVPDTTLNHAETADGNCTNLIRPYNNSFECGGVALCDGDICAGQDANASIAQYSVGSRVMPFRANAYYIGRSDVVPSPPAGSANLPVLALKREVLSASNSGGSYSEELAQGIESMDVLYGIDGPDDDSVADRFVTADQLPLAGDSDNRVTAVRLMLVFRSQSRVFGADEVIPKTINGVEFADGYLRQVASTTVSLRN